MEEGRLTYRLVHHAESNLGVALVLGGNLRPDAGELGVGRTALADNGAVPAAVVVEVDDTQCSAGIQAALDLLVVGGPVVGVEGAADAVDEVLPTDGDTEGVEAVVVDEVLHLVEAGLARVDDAAGVAGAVGSAAEVETSDLWNDALVVDRLNRWSEAMLTYVDTGILNASGRGASLVDSGRSGCSGLCGRSRGLLGSGRGLGRGGLDGCVLG